MEPRAAILASSAYTALLFNDFSSLAPVALSGGR
jgi:hypothetical protein